MKSTMKIFASIAVMAFAFAACGDDESVCKHQWGEWAETNAPTCTTAGEETRTCALNAAHIETRAVAAAHIWGEWQGTNAPTCTANGSGTRACAACPATETDNDIPALGHSIAPTENVHTQPTCTEGGFEELACTRCTHTEAGSALPALGHDYAWATTTPASCVAAGSETGTCARANCTDTTARTIAIDAAAHLGNSGSWTSKTAAAETTDGEDERSCAACGGKEIRILYATGTEGLAYELINDGTAYRVWKGTVTNGAVHIPAYRLSGDGIYLPVTEVDVGSEANVSGAFYSTSITGVTFLAPSNITLIGQYAFRYCTALTNVTIPNSVTTILHTAFSGCTALTSVTIPNSVTFIDGDTFFGCTALTSVTIPNSVTFIGYNAFYGCTALTSVTIPNSVTSIGYNAFISCTALVSVTIGSGVTSIGSDAFLACTELTSITVDAANPNFVSQNGILYNKAMTTLIQAPAKGIPGVFTIPNSVTSIGDYAFYSCTALVSVTIPDSVTSIGDRAFSDCTALMRVTMLRATPPTLGAGLYGTSRVFNSNHASRQFFVPSASVAAYKAAQYWSAYASSIYAIQPPQSPIPAFKNSTFEGITTGENVTLVSTGGIGNSAYARAQGTRSSGTLYFNFFPYEDRAQYYWSNSGGRNYLTLWVKGTVSDNANYRISLGSTTSGNSWFNLAGIPTNPASVHIVTSLQPATAAWNTTATPAAVAFTEWKKIAVDLSATGLALANQYFHIRAQAGTLDLSVDEILFEDVDTALAANP